MGSNNCEKVNNLDYNQHLFAKIGKYVIMALAAWNLLREVNKCDWLLLHYINIAEFSCCIPGAVVVMILWLLDL